jgi:predicted porin
MKHILMPAAAAGLALAFAPAHADLSMTAGDWTIKFDGNVNGYYVHTGCESNPGEVLGGLACTRNEADSDTRSKVRTGLLPSKLGFSASTTQNDMDIQAYVSFWPGADDGVSSDRNTALGMNTANFRQVFLTAGSDTIGTFKIGRDLGIFGADAILSDMSLLGVGTVSDFTINGGNTSLGRIGTGYMYADWKAQVSYLSPSFNGLTFAVGIMDPWDPITVAPGDNSLAEQGKKESPGFEGRVAFDWDGNLSGRVWGGVITQEVKTAADSFTATGFELGGKAGIAGFEGVLYYYEGKGIGTTVFLNQAASADGERRESDGWYVQGTYTIPNFGTKLGLSYGESSLDRNAGDPATLLDKNSSMIAGVYHPLTANLNLVAEYTDTKAENHAGDDNREKSFAVGAILFF